MKNNLTNIKAEIENYASASNLTELQVVEKLKDYYFNKKVNDNLKLYKKGKKKINYTKYNKNKEEQQPNISK